VRPVLVVMPDVGDEHVVQVRVGQMSKRLEGNELRPADRCESAAACPRLVLSGDEGILRRSLVPAEPRLTLSVVLTVTTAALVERDEPVDRARPLGAACDEPNTRMRRAAAAMRAAHAYGARIASGFSTDEGRRPLSKNVSVGEPWRARPECQGRQA
jgi:hypothetical protein